MAVSGPLIYRTRMCSTGLCNWFCPLVCLFFSKWLVCIQPTSFAAVAWILWDISLACCIFTFLGSWKKKKMSCIPLWLVYYVYVHYIGLLHCVTPFHAFSLVYIRLRIRTFFSVPHSAVLLGGGAECVIEWCSTFIIVYWQQSHAAWLLTSHRNCTV